MTDTQTTQAHPLTVIEDQLNERTVAIRKALPKHVEVERFKRSVVLWLMQNPDLVTANRPSLFNAINQIAGVGLLINGTDAIIVGYKSKDRGLIAQAQIPIQGRLKLFRQSGQFKTIFAEVVRDDEPFRYWIDDTGQHITHDPGDGEGPIIKVYAVAHTKDDGRFVEVFTRKQIEQRRAVSRAKDGPMWTQWWQEAAQKTVLRSLLKLLPSSSDDLERLNRFDEEDDSIDISALPSDPPGHWKPPQKLSVASALDRIGGETPVVDAEAPPISEASPPETNQTAEPPADGAPLTPHGEALAKARELGVHHRKQGMQRRALPPEYRGAERKAEADAWFEGWDSGG